MSRIDSLSIYGIRSFDNTRSEVIKFYTPLTLIAGHNGSGKTTIIECLKFAATGDQPPNTKGGAFIHDPLLCNEKEVLAQAKMRFTSTTNATMVITRSLQLSVNKTSRKMKTLDGTLLMLRDGEKITVSQRNVELNQIVPQYLGVSKAILDNVVFCHQDESLWPLSEPSVLKKKFDEIFEALKYTKAIDNLKIIKKKQAEELKRLQLIEQHEKDNKNKGERAERRSIQLQNEIQSMQDRRKELEAQRDEAQANANDAWNKASHYEDILSRLNGKQIAAQSKEESTSDLKNDIEELRDSDEALQSMLDQYEERAATYATDIKERQEQYTALDRQSAETNEALGLKQKEQGQFQAEKNHYEQQIQDRQTIVKDIAQQQNIRGFDYDLTDARIQDFATRVDRLARDQSAVVERSREKSKLEISEVQSQLTKLNEQKYALSQSKEHSKDQIGVNDKKIAGHDRSLKAISVDDGARANLESAVDNLRQSLQNLKSKSDASDWDHKIQVAEQTLRTLDERKEKLDAEIVETTKHAKETAELDHLHKRLKESETGLNTMLGAHADRLNKMIGTSWRDRDIEAVYQRVLDRKSSEIKEAQHKADQLGFELNQSNYKMANNKQDTKTKLQKKEQYAKEVQEAIGEDDLINYHEVLSYAEEDVGVKKRDLELCKWYMSCIETLKEHKCCRLCVRQFDKPSELNNFDSSLRKRIEGLDTKEMAKELKQTEEDLHQLRSVASSFSNWQVLSKTEIPGMRRELVQLEAEHKSILAQAEEADSQVKKLESAKRDIDVVANNIKQIAKYQSDIKIFQEQIQTLSQKVTTPNLSRGLETIYDDQKAVVDQTKSARKDLSGLRTERENSKTEINHMEIDIRDMNEKLKDAVGQLKERDSVNAQRAELIELNRQQRETISELDKKLQQLDPQLAQCQARLEDTERRAQEEQEQLQREEALIRSRLDKLNAAQKDINAYIERGGPDQLAQVQRDIETNMQQQKKIQEQRTELIKDINKLKQQAQSHGDTKRNIERNLKYRKDKEALKQLLEEINELKNQYVAADQAQYTEEAKTWETKRNAFSAEANDLTGQTKSKDKELEVLQQDWNTDYKDAASKFREANIKVQTTAAAIKDLGQYTIALDNAIMEYHKRKMEEINVVVDELWRKTYQGTDVDTIVIKSDNDNEKSNKSYHYRVCMVKQDAQMDMRGRCSAGQRVLASIIIRLALAECFGVSCGLIALDEPTTNLDRDNIQALAVALHDIIKTRQQQSNFQLIVITHDDDFMKLMRCTDFCDYYYRVSRSENQKSQIERQSLAQIG